MSESCPVAPFYFEGRNESEECGVEVDAFLVRSVEPSPRGEGWSRVHYASGAEYEARVPPAELEVALERAKAEASREPEPWE